ncbi:hypothetical protein FSP39_013509 [Pinctada imbricata]|uniref:Tetraspanin n=1 Tax=Pinctada imbricata TaxID=66713 RepID=A0AA88YEX2_PINIB|nr:hypothetical protein FSP39_013509 [Pinctada imbricata]
MGCFNTRDTFVSPVVKYVLFFFNFFCWLFGGVLIGIGVWAYIEKNKYYYKEIQTVYDVVFDLSIIFMVLGIVIFIIGYAGCIGALRENIILLKVYYISMIVIFLALVVGAIVAFIFRDKVKEELTSLLQDNLITRYQDDPDGQSTIDWIQENIQCCGVNSYKDWNRNEYFNCTNDGRGNQSPLACSVPHSCCKDQDSITAGVPNILCGQSALKSTGDTSIIYTIGCIDGALVLAENSLPLVGGIVIGLAVPQVGINSSSSVFTVEAISLLYVIHFMGFGDTTSDGQTDGRDSGYAPHPNERAYKERNNANTKYNILAGGILSCTEQYPPGDDESETDIRSFMISPSTSTSSPAQRTGDGYNGYDMTIFDGFRGKYDNVATSLPSDSDDDTHCDDVASRTTDDADRSRTEYKLRSSGETSESNMRRMVRRLSSFHERIPIRIQNFLLKYTLFSFNFLSWLTGMTAVGVGTWQLTDENKVISDAVNFILDPFVVLCIIGAITFTVAFLGCVGAAREHAFMIKMFHIALSVVLVVELVCGALVIIFYSNPDFREWLRLTPDKLLKDAILKYMDDKGVQVWMDMIQKQFQCCGISATDYGYKDWQLNMYYNCSDINPSVYACAVPESCCIVYPGERMNKMCGFDKSDKKLSDVREWIYTQGCVKGFGEWISNHEMVILLTACVVMFMQFLGVVFARIFVKRIQRRIKWTKNRNRRCS